MTRIVTTRSESVTASHHLPARSLLEQRCAELVASNTPFEVEGHTVWWTETRMTHIGRLVERVQVTFEEDQ
ncbi:hypothetical protein [Tomitella gaofuii]|uniref:hypothetical protein n=1 Tax=Tomitella gaofuii TaxID=2760083 RepID=UPI0015FC6924|nr:hypothetical protein [Tomitella gaofuii]